MSTPAAPTASAPQASATPAQGAPNQQTTKPVQGAEKVQPQGGKVAQPGEAPRMMKIKVDGKEMELSETEVLELASAGKSSSQRFQEAAKMRKEAEAILKFAKDNPAEFFQKTGMNAREWAEAYLLDQLKREAESPEQKKARENEEKLRKYEAHEKSRQEEVKRGEQERLTNEQREKYDKLFTDALVQSGLPRTPFTVRRMAELQLTNIRKGLELTPQQLAKIVREDYVSEQKSLMGSLDGDQLIEFLGADLVKKLSKAQIAKLKGRSTGGTSAGSSPRAPQSQKQSMSWRDYQKKNRGRAA